MDCRADYGQTFVFRTLKGLKAHRTAVLVFRGIDRMSAFPAIRETDPARFPNCRSGLCAKYGMVYK